MDGTEIANWLDMVAAVSGRPGMETEITFVRDGVPARNHPGAGAHRGGRRNPRPHRPLHAPLREYPHSGTVPWRAVWEAIDYNWRMIDITVRSLGRMLTREMSSENLSGPITIARIAGDTVESGLVDFLRFLAIISVSLGLLNLLPIPMLDGGHLMYFLVEAITGREPSEGVMFRGQQIGIVLLVLLMGLAFYNDIMRLFGLI